MNNTLKGFSNHFLKSNEPVDKSCSRSCVWKKDFKRLLNLFDLSHRPTGQPSDNRPYWLHIHLNSNSHLKSEPSVLEVGSQWMERTRSRGVHISMGLIWIDLVWFAWIWNWFDLVRIGSVGFVLIDFILSNLLLVHLARAGMFCLWLSKSEFSSTC